MTSEPDGGASRAGDIPAPAAWPAAASPGRAGGDALGLVVGTVPATPLQFSVGLAAGQYAQLDDVVVTHRELPGQPGVQISGVVTNVEAMHEGARFSSDVFLIEQGALPAEVCEVAEVSVTRVEPEVYVPPLPGAAVTRAVGGQRDSALFVMLDELNKYAPREGDSPIKQILLDVAERGRSRGVILIGAQQTASEVERRILSNCAIRVAGRLDAAEAERPEYGYLPPAQRQRATLAKPGTMFIAQPDIPVPLAVDFPFPAWATRPSEKGKWAGQDTGPARPADPFAAIPGADDDPPPF